MEGDEKTAMLAKAVTGRKNKKKAREEENLRMWSKDPTIPNLREIGPKSIVANVHQFGDIQNPIVEVNYTLLSI